MMAVHIEVGAAPIGASRPLFEVVSFATVAAGNAFLYAPAPNGSRFLVDRSAPDVQPTLEIILNWGSTEHR
jgi:hypothetical protein